MTAHSALSRQTRVRSNAPVIRALLERFANESQRRHFLSRLENGWSGFALAFSEPDSGSDLRDVSCRAQTSGDGIVLSGQKSWVSGVEAATEIVVLCRMDAAAGGGGQLAMVFVPCRSAGIGITPHADMTGERFCELGFRDVAVPLRNVLACDDDAALIDLLTASRADPRDHDALMRDGFDFLLRHADHGSPLSGDRLGGLYAGMRIVGGFERRAEMGQGGRPWGPLLKSVFSRRQRRTMGETMPNLIGSAPMAALERLQCELLEAPGMTLADGALETQLDLLAELALGLPRSVEAPTDRLPAITDTPKNA